jgi:hypothetical protein
MIWESGPWKESLLKSADFLAKVSLTTRTSETTLVRIEKELMIGFYSIRKLLDTFKISNNTKAMTFDIKWYPNIKSVDYMNWHKLSDLFDLGKQNTETRDLGFICDRFVHSFVFIPASEHRKLSGVYISSDRDKKQKCYFIELPQILNAFRTVGNDYPSTLELTRDPSTGQFKGTAR